MASTTLTSGPGDRHQELGLRGGRLVAISDTPPNRKRVMPPNGHAPGAGHDGMAQFVQDDAGEEHQGRRPGP